MSKEIEPPEQTEKTITELNSDTSYKRMQCLQYFGEKKVAFFFEGNSLVVQWLGLHNSTAGGTGSIPSWEVSKILHAAQCSRKKKKMMFSK